MIIYRVTVTVDKEVIPQWFKWMREQHIADVLATKKFTSSRLVRVISETKQARETYQIDYFAKSKALLNEYYVHHAPELREEGIRKFGDKFTAFRTELEVLDLVSEKSN